MHYAASSELGDDVFLGVLKQGRIGYRSRIDECVCVAGDAFAVPYGEQYEAAMHDPDVLTLQIPIERVIQAAQANSGPLREPLGFQSVRPVSAAMNGLFGGSIRMAVEELTSPEGRAFEYPLIARQLVDVVIAALLNGIANSTMVADYRPEPRASGSAVVRRAVDFIDEHAAEPISAADVADAVAVDARELRAAFVRDHDITPTGYLRRVRLEGAHRDLSARTPGGGDTVATVAAIARRWGFANPRLFAAYFRATYGRAPGVTLGEDPT